MRKRSDSNKAPSWNGNQPHIMMQTIIIVEIKSLGYSINKKVK
ncbi:MULTISPECIES: hypothetical protein [unclassified Lysinibacillus]|nr:MULTISPECIES: hypothetical protein [unclassified Lysinibacillus]MDM5249706.1 hypothetical protein [Lysinibacillus sp. G4S2]